MPKYGLRHVMTNKGNKIRLFAVDLSKTITDNVVVESEDGMQVKIPYSDGTIGIGYKMQTEDGILYVTEEFRKMYESDLSRSFIPSRA